MGKSTSKSDKTEVVKKQQKPKREVQVVACPFAFPISEKVPSIRPPRPGQEEYNKRQEKRARKKIQDKLLDWHDTSKEIRAYGAQGYTGKQKREYQDEQYLLLTGRNKKKASCPLPIVRGIKKAAVAREKRERQEAKEAGIVIPNAKKEVKKSQSSTIRSYGPAPNIGFMSKGIFKVKDKKKR